MESASIVEIKAENLQEDIILDTRKRNTAEVLARAGKVGERSDLIHQRAIRMG